MAAHLRLLVIAGAVLLAAIAAAALIPEGWQVRTGLHWLVEHFLAFFAVTLVFCAAWRRPMLVAAVMLPLALAIETLQALTPDRTADLATALMAAAGVAMAALFADLVLRLRASWFETRPSAAPHHEDSSSSPRGGAGPRRLEG